MNSLVSVLKRTAQVLLCLRAAIRALVVLLTNIWLGVTVAYFILSFLLFLHPFWKQKNHSHSISTLLFFLWKAELQQKFKKANMERRDSLQKINNTNISGKNPCCSVFLLPGNIWKQFCSWILEHNVTDSFVKSKEWTFLSPWNSLLYNSPEDRCLKGTCWKKCITSHTKIPLLRTHHLAISPYIWYQITTVRFCINLKGWLTLRF